jgi:ketosteroid isomerase-like protein
MKSILVGIVLALTLCGCAGKSKKPVGANAAATKAAGTKTTGFASADAKNIHDLVALYPVILMSGDVKSIMRFYTDDARIVPFWGNIIRPVRTQDMPKFLPALVAEEKQAGLRIAWREPMHIEVTGETATVQAVADLSWKAKGQPQQSVMNCYFGLVRDANYVWRVRESHGEPVKKGFTLPAQTTPKKPLPARDPKLKARKTKGTPDQNQPATAPAPETAPTEPPAPQDTGASPGFLAPDDGKTPQPLF